MTVVYYLLFRDPHNLIMGEFTVLSHSAAITALMLICFASDMLAMVCITCVLFMAVQCH